MDCALIFYSELVNVVKHFIRTEQLLINAAIGDPSMLSISWRIALQFGSQRLSSTGKITAVYLQYVSTSLKLSPRTSAYPNIPKEVSGRAELGWTKLS
jgi:hypothetical protein